MSEKAAPPLLNTTESRGSISNAPMHEIDPSPVDEEPQSSDTLPTYYSETKSSSSSTNFLGLTPARTTHFLQAIQQYSVIPPAVYLTMHYTNTALIPLFTQSLQTSDKLLLLTRPYYQSFPLEPLLIFVPIVTHVASGITLRVYRRRQNAKRHGAYTHKDRQTIPWPKLSLTSALGYALYPMMAAHVLVNRITPQNVDGGSSSVGLRYFAHGIAKHPILTSIGYAGMLGVASWHFVTGGAKYLKLSSEYITDGGDYGAKRKRNRGWIINGVAALMAAAWIAGGLGVIGRGGSGQGWEAKHWDEIYRAVPGLGRWL